MRKSEQGPAASSHWDSELRLLLWLATCVSIFSCLFYFQRGEAMLYGDAVAHINIARRVFDSKTPGLLQLGTVWLPLPHLLMIPFLISDEMWRRGVGGSIPSLVAYVLGVVGIFRLVRGTLSTGAVPDAASRVAAWAAAMVFAANPNLIYMQTTAMGESLYLAFFIWAIAHFAESLRGDPKALPKTGLCLAAACLTRYDGWFLSAAMAACVLLPHILPAHAQNAAQKLLPSRIEMVKFILIAAAAPALWLVYNGLVYGNPLEFENGPYSAKAIERKTQNLGNPGHPGSGHVLSAGMYFLKSAEANVAQTEWLQRTWVLVALAAILGAALSNRFQQNSATIRAAPLLPLLVPLPFYALSVAYGGVPIFIPAWWPFTHYNVRYGLQLLPAFAAALAVLVHLVVRFNAWNLRLRSALVLGLFTFAIASYASIWKSGPITLTEAQINMRTRNQLEAELAVWLGKLPPDSTLLMYLGDHVGALQRAGIPLKHVINEGNHRVWMQSSDPEGLWERALADPARYSDYVVAFEGDPVWRAVASRHLPALVEIHVTGQARAFLFRAR